jgi:hypothetical protein
MMIRQWLWITAAITSISACAPSLQQSGLDGSQHIASFLDQATSPAATGSLPSSDQVAGAKPAQSPNSDEVAAAKPTKPAVRVAKRAPTAATAGPGADLGPAITVEPDAEIDDTLKGESKLVSGLIGLVRARGYQCGAVSAVKPSNAANGFDLACDHHRYKYAIEDSQGGWKITSK